MKKNFARYLYFPLLILLLSIQLSLNCSSEQEKMTQEFKQFLASYEDRVIPLSKESNLAYFMATTTGEDSLYSKLEHMEVELAKIFANQADFEKLSEIKKSNTIQDPQLKRQLEILYNAYLEKQLNEEILKEIISMQTDIEKRYSTFRSEFDGKKYTDNEIEDILVSSRSSRTLEKAWKASKQIGMEVVGDVLKLVDLRNSAAKELGFDNYHTMQLVINDQDPREIDALFNELDSLTRDSFIQLKSDMDRFLGRRFRRRASSLMPWHYQNRFFQEAPKIYNVDLDQFFRNRDVVGLTRKYFAGLGLPIDDLIAKSDLYEREGKYQHAYCTDIDRKGDVRVVCNVRPNQRWMNTMLHEYGHAVYDKFNDRNLPWTLRRPAHTFTTEAIAMLMGNFASNPHWIGEILEISDSRMNRVADDCVKSLRLETLVFSRWAQVMYRFERAMYANPDQDLNKLWWDLVEKYQMIKRPPGRNHPDWAAKIHVALYPAYYHNYLMGNILASQIYYHIGKEVLKSENVTEQTFYGKKEVGTYLIEEIFKPGALYHWNDMIAKATNEKLTAKYYALQFIE
ncbi:MAG: M2 family metallopeptidase [Calditrichia bacterium]|nr:M2 family metallopeptidase [Calditrichia bacterium]